jgi:DNA-directed RNA polymerase specialized sigma24 family protein
VAIAAMLVAGTARGEIAETLGVPAAEVAWRARRIVARMRPRPSPTAETAVHEAAAWSTHEGPWASR